MDQLSSTSAKHQELMDISNEKFDELTDRFDLQQRIIYKLNHVFKQHQSIFTKFFEIKTAKKKTKKSQRTKKQKVSKKRKAKKQKVSKKNKLKKQKVSKKRKAEKIKTSHKVNTTKKRIKKSLR